jgi:hypothetical protein
MSEQQEPSAVGAAMPKPGDVAFAIAVLLYVALYLWGFILGVMEVSRRTSAGGAEPH